MHLFIRCVNNHSLIFQHNEFWLPDFVAIYTNLRTKRTPSTACNNNDCCGFCGIVMAFVEVMGSNLKSTHPYFDAVVILISIIRLYKGMPTKIERAIAVIKVNVEILFIFAAKLKNH